MAPDDPQVGGRDCRLQLVIGPNGPALTVRCGGVNDDGDDQADITRARDCLYQGANYSGSRFCTGIGTTNALNRDFDNRVSSLRTERGARVRLCSGRNLAGDCRIYTRNTPALGTLLDNRASSLRVFTGTVPAPLPSEQEVHSSGSITLRRTYAADLDTGGTDDYGDDIWFEAETTATRFIAPLNRARLALGNGSNRGYEGCRVARFSSARIELATIPIGTYVCARTDEGRIAQFRVVGSTMYRLSITYTTWAD